MSQGRTKGSPLATDSKSGCPITNRKCLGFVEFGPIGVSEFVSIMACRSVSASLNRCSVSSSSNFSSPLTIILHKIKETLYILTEYLYFTHILTFYMVFLHSETIHPIPYISIIIILYRPFDT